ncbi:MAG: hypothetical protein OHK0053_07030 [Microscillaceae bacterium]
MRQIIFWAVLLVLLFFLYWINWDLEPQNDLARLQENYASEVEQICQEMQLPAPYFKALIILESSARKPAPSRFEPHVFARLREVQTGSRPRYGRFTTSQLSLLSQDELKAMATSWGPLQVMGYHCIPMGLSISQLQGERGLWYAIQWADKSYGKWLRRGDFENAFHIHNTGQPLPQDGQPRTHDPHYIQKGLDWVKKLK